MRNQIRRTGLFLICLVWKASAETKTGCKDMTYYDAELIKKFPTFSSYDGDVKHGSDPSKCDPASIRARGPVSEWCGESYQVDLGLDGKTKLDKSKWMIPEINPAFYARRCYAGEKCVVGYYKDQKFPEGRSADMKERAGRCVPCHGHGKYSDGKVVNQPKCSVCPAGQFAHKKYAKSCEICPKGTSSSGGSTRCAGCPKGTYAATAGSKCLTCPNGRFANTTNSTSCHACPPGRWSHNKGGSMSECKACRAGHASSKSAYDGTDYHGADKSLYGCPSCTAGRYASGLGQSECKACEKGRYAAAKIASVTCIACQKGQFSNVLASAEQKCQFCEAGRYASDPGQSECKDCGPGYVSASNSGSHHCKACLPGRFSSENRAIGQCKPCDKGRFASEPGSKECKDCGKGYISAHDSASASCDACEAGRFSTLDRATKCNPCAGGYFANTTGLSLCKTCGAGALGVSKK